MRQQRAMLAISIIPGNATRIINMTHAKFADEQTSTIIVDDY